MADEYNGVNWMDVKFDASIRLPLFYLLDVSINALFYHPLLFSHVQDILVLLLVIVFSLLCLICVTCRNRTIISFYCFALSSFCIFLVYCFTIEFIHTNSTKNVDYLKNRDLGSFLVPCLNLLLLQTVGGCVLALSYLFNPLMGRKYCPVWTVFIFIPSMIFTSTYVYLRQPFILIYFFTFPALPLVLFVKRQWNLYWVKARLLFHISAQSGHVEFLVGYLAENVEPKMLRLIMSWYWLCNQIVHTLPLLVDLLLEPTLENTYLEEPRSLHSTYSNETSPLSGDHYQVINPVNLNFVFRTFVYNCTRSWVIIACTSAILTHLANVLELFFSFLLERRSPEDFPTYCAALYMIASLQSNLAYLTPEHQYIRFLKNSITMAVGVLHFTHMSSIPVVEAIGAANNRKLSRHLKIYLLFTLELSIASCIINLALTRPWNTWSVAVTLFCSEVIFKVTMLIIVYIFFFTWDFFKFHHFCSLFSQDFDDVLSNIKLFTSSVLFLFGWAIFVNGLYVLVFEDGGKVRALLLGLHAYSNIFLEWRDGWRKFHLRMEAAKKLEKFEIVNLLQHNVGHKSEGTASDDSQDSETEKPSELINEHVCPICYTELEVAMKTKCNHLFHKNCFRKWIYIQNFCPLCKVDLD